MNLKPKLNFDEMLEHMDKKGIQFNMVLKCEAKEILQKSNYFFKVLSYRQNFVKNSNGEYINLEFGMLTDLSTIDMRLRYIVLHMCLDIEHNIKTKMLTDITNDKTEDGYDIVQDFFNECNVNVETLLKPMEKENAYNYGIYNKYGKDLPVWVLFEIMSFGLFVTFVEFYYKRSANRYYKNLFKLLRYVKNIRNCAAHNSPLLMEIVNKDQIRVQVENFVSEYVSKVQFISKSLRRKRLKNRKIHDLTVLIAVHDTYIDSKPMKEARYTSLKELLERSLRNKDKYQKHESLVSVFHYFNNIVDFINTKVVYS